MKKLSILILALSIFFAVGIYFSRDYKFEHYAIEPKSNELKTYKINLNLANWHEFDNLPGIGPSLAKRIIQDRKNNGRFNSIEELKRVPGIGETKFEALRDYITLEVQ